VKELFAGAAIAAVAGMLMGAAAKPDLNADDRPAGPQMLASVAGARNAGPFADDSASFAAYHGKLPDYVLGTDFARATSIYPSAYAPPPMKVVAYHDDPEPETPVTHVAYADDPAAKPSFPSIDGGKPDADPAAPVPADPTLPATGA
jgi:hypothetical protein